ncbi:NlpC/P60 family protein [Chryseobacterium sp. 1B4]
MKFYLENYLVIIIFPALFSGFISCRNASYLDDLPYIYNSERYGQNSEDAKKYIDSVFVHVDHNSDRLSDEELDIKERYSIIMGVMPKEVTNYNLYSFIDGWIGTPYRKDTADQELGVDCGHFISQLFNEVYKETLSPSPENVFGSKSLELFTGRNFLKEGDILFLRYDKLHPISDEAIYLQNDKIVACTASGLNIYDFNDKYFQLRYVAAGRLKSKR